MLGVCERFGCLPSQLEREDAELLRLLEIETLATPKEDREVNGSDGW